MYLICSLEFSGIESKIENLFRQNDVFAVWGTLILTFRCASCTHIYCPTLHTCREVDVLCTFLQNRAFCLNYFEHFAQREFK